MQVPEHRQRRWFAGLVGSLLLATLGTGCGPDDSATFALSASAESCAADVFPFEPTLFAATETTNGAILRMQADSRERTRADAFYITIVEDDSLGECADLDTLEGQAVTVGPAECVQAFFRLNDSCLDDFLNPQVEGTLTFERLGFAKGDIVQGTITGTLSNFKVGELGDTIASSAEPIGEISGDFEFEVRLGPQYQVFATPPP